MQLAHVLTCTWHRSCPGMHLSYWVMHLLHIMSGLATSTCLLSGHAPAQYHVQACADETIVSCICTAWWECVTLLPCTACLTCFWLHPVSMMYLVCITHMLGTTSQRSPPPPHNNWLAKPNVTTTEKKKSPTHSWQCTLYNIQYQPWTGHQNSHLIHRKLVTIIGVSLACGSEGTVLNMWPSGEPLSGGRFHHRWHHDPGSTGQAGVDITANRCVDGPGIVDTSGSRSSNFTPVLDCFQFTVVQKTVCWFIFPTFLVLGWNLVSNWVVCTGSAWEAVGHPALADTGRGDVHRGRHSGN